MNSPSPSFVPPLPSRPKPKPAYMRRGEVWRLCQKNRISMHTFKQIFGPECEARVQLTKRGRAHYVRVKVLALLGLKEDA